ncbi:MAG: hypothetical protein K0S23_2325 [Fluviicola sp.]|nr:hypothetical protein [Fluviicola sp.]
MKYLDFLCSDNPKKSSPSSFDQRLSGWSQSSFAIANSPTSKGGSQKIEFFSGKSKLISK